MLSKQGIIKILDFGRAHQTPDIYKSKARGSLRYLSPELKIDGLYSKASDIYALGVCFFELLTTKTITLPTNPKRYQEILVQETKELPEGELLQKLLAFNPQQRPSAEQIQQRLSRSNNQKLKDYASKHIPTLLTHRFQHYQHHH